MLGKRNVRLSKITEPDDLDRAQENWGFKACSAEIAAYTLEEIFISSGVTSIRLSGNPHLINCHYPSSSIPLTIQRYCRSQREN